VQHLPVLGIVLAAASIASAFSVKATNWAVMTDELQSSKLATSIAETFSPEPRIHGVYYHALSQLYPLLISPFFGLLRVPAAIEATHALNGLLLASAAWPAGLLARRVTRSWPAAYLAAALTAFVPWLVLAATLLTENAAYPVFVWSLLLMQRALARATLRADAGALLGLVLAFFARTQLLVLTLAFPLALVGYELARELSSARLGLRRLAPRSLITRVLRCHPLVVGAYGAVGLAVAGLAAAGRLDEVLGTYARTVESNPFPSGIWNAAAVHLDYLVIGVGVVPFLLASSWALGATIRVRDPDAQAFAVLLVVLVPLITLQAASFDERFTPGGFTEDRYLLYLAPLFAVGAAAAVVDRERLGRRALLIVGFAASFCVLTLFELHPPSVAIFWAAPAASFQDALGSAAGSIGLSTRAFVGWGSLIIGVMLAATLWRAPPFTTVVAVGFTSVALCAGEAVYVFDRFAVPTTTRPRTIENVRRDWVDTALPDAPSVALVPNPNLGRNFWWDVEFWNKRVDRVLRVDGDRIHTPFPALQFSVDPKSGTLRGLGSTHFLVLASSENRIHLRDARVVASAPPLKLVAVGRPRVDWSTSGTYPDGWSRPGQELSLRVFSVDGARVREARVTLRAAPARAGVVRFEVRGRGFLRRHILVPGASRLLSLGLCVPERGTAEVTFLSRNGVRLPDGRVVGVRIDRVEMVDTGRPCPRSSEAVN
jgi:hypothetical protein